MPSDLAAPIGLRRGFAVLRRAGHLRHREIATALHASEGELVAAHAGPFDLAESPLKAVRLHPEWPELVGSLEPLGEVMALTRNDSCVHEKVGVYRNASASDHVGLVLGGEIDLRVFYRRWAHGFAVEETLADGREQRSLQFFDAQGQAVHKVFLREGSDVGAYRHVCERFRDPSQRPGIVAVAAGPVEPEALDTAIDVAGLHQAWSSMRDTHEFFGLLRRFGVSRRQALRLAPPAFAEPVDCASAHHVLSQAAQQSVPIMVFVGNVGTIQIHSGPVRRVEVMGPWLNVLDAGFNLHLREDRIASAWRVRKPTSDGLVSSLELFDAAGSTIAMFFGERKPQRPELCAWRSLLDDLSVEALLCAAGPA